jgi:hypothetical protein
MTLPDIHRALGFPSLVDNHTGYYDSRMGPCPLVREYDPGKEEDRMGSALRSDEVIQSGWRA